MLYFSCFFALVSCIVQRASTEQDGGVYPKLNSSERFGNFSVELLYHVGEFQTGNFIISPFNAWSVLASVAEGALRSTRLEIANALRLYKKTNSTRSVVQGVMRELQLNSTTVQLVRFNAILIDKSKSPEADFREICRLYDTFNVPVNLMDARVTTSRTNKAVTVATKGLITKIVDENDFREPQMIIMSAAYLKGQWSAAFNPSSSSIRPFYDSNGVQTGQVNMMYNRFTYPLADIWDLQASVIELPYGSEGRFSMIVMLPNKGVSLQRMIMNTQKVPLDVVFSELRLDQQEHGDDVVECLLPRFKIDSNLELKNVLKKLGIFALFNETTVALARIARFNPYVTKVIHKTVIEVAEEGIPGTESAPELKAPGVTSGLPKFEANRPFAFLVLEKITNTVLLEGLYKQPYLD